VRFKIFGYLKSLEDKVNDGVSVVLFKGYKAIKKRGVEKIIDDIYSQLPEDVHNARKYLKNKNFEIEKNQKTSLMYDSLKDFETTLAAFVSFADVVVVNIKEMEKLINKIYDSIPEEIIKAKNIQE
jgi:hypothetical protein